MPKRTRATKETDRKGEKAWLKKSKLSKYGQTPREINKTFLIICEGQTEKLYFDAFPVVSAKVRSVDTGSSKMALVKKAEDERKKGDYDEVWCVFDLDRDPSKGPQQNSDFNNAVSQCAQKGFGCAYSNDAFELWYVLHFALLQQQHDRSICYDRLSKEWGINYEKDGKVKAFASTVYSRLADHMDTAIKNARKLTSGKEPLQPHKQNPITMVFELVEELRKYFRK
jgi:hypothetical protein